MDAFIYLFIYFIYIYFFLGERRKARKQLGKVRDAGISDVLKAVLEGVASLKGIACS